MLSQFLSLQDPLVVLSFYQELPRVVASEITWTLLSGFLNLLCVDFGRQAWCEGFIGYQA